MNLRQKIFFWLWVALVVGLVLFGIIWIIIANNNASQEANNLTNALLTMLK